MIGIQPIPIQNATLDHPQGILNAHLYCIGKDFWIYQPHWYHSCCKCVWVPPTPEQYRIACINFQNHVVAHYGATSVRQAQDVCEVYLEDKIQRQKPLLVREMLSIHNSLIIMNRSIDIVKWHEKNRKEAPKSIGSSTKSVGILEVDMESCEITEKRGSESDDDPDR